MELLREFGVFLLVVFEGPVYVPQIGELGRKQCNGARFDAAGMAQAGIQCGD